MKQNLLVTGLVSVLMAGFVLAYVSIAGGGAPGRMETMGGGEDAAPPPVSGYAAGEDILFLHTEASDPEIAGVLTEMMGSPVLTVPSLAEAPDSMLAGVFVFRNGVAGNGPLGFQPDVFEHPPGTPAYRPLRRVHFVTWEASSPRELRSAAALREAETRGELRVEPSGVVVNMPIVRWPGGQR